MTLDTKLLAYGLGALLALLGAANAWLDIAAATEGPWQMIGMVGIAAVGLAGLWLLPGLILPVSCLLVALALCLVLGFFRTDPLFLRLLMPILGYAAAIWLVSGLLMRLIPPRLPRERRHLAMVVGAMLAFGHLAVALAMFQIADPVFRLGRDPVADAGEEVRIAAIDAARARRYGQFVEATVTPGVGEAPAVARVLCAPAPGPRQTRTFTMRRDTVEGPRWFDVTLADGSALRVQRVDYRYQTQDWPDRGGALGCRVEAGDVVTLWATPVRAGETGLTLSDTRFIGYGDAETVLAQIAPVAERDARRFGGLAFFVALTAILPLLAGFLAWRRRDRSAAPAA